MSKGLEALKQAVSAAQPTPTPESLSNQPLSAEERLKALKSVETALNKQFSTTHSLVKLGSKVGLLLPSIATDIYTLDYGVIGTGGIPRGRIIEFYGPESSGKTTAALHVVGKEQAAGGLAAYIDAEHSLDPSYMAKLGVDVDNLVVAQPDSGEQALETLIALIKSRAITLGVVDSVSALTPQAELDGEMGESHMGLQARLMSQAMRKLRGICAETNIPVIFINQIREKIGVMFGSPETTSGGRALKFYASLRLDIRKVGGEDGTIKSGGVVIGHKTRFRAVKNKVGPPVRTTEVDLIYGVGYDTLADFAEYAVNVGAIQQSGAWYVLPTANAERFQGMAKLKDALKSEPTLMQSVRAEVAKAQKAQREADAQ